MKGKKVSADDVFFWANWVLVGALVLGVIATYAIVASGNIRDKELKRELAEAEERTEGLRKSNLTLQGEVALLPMATGSGNNPFFTFS